MRAWSWELGSIFFAAAMSMSTRAFLSPTCLSSCQMASSFGGTPGALPRIEDSPYDLATEGPEFSAYALPNRPPPLHSTRALSATPSYCGCIERSTSSRGSTMMSGLVMYNQWLGFMTLRALQLLRHFPQCHLAPIDMAFSVISTPS